MNQERSANLSYQRIGKDLQTFSSMTLKIVMLFSRRSFNVLKSHVHPFIQFADDTLSLQDKDCSKEDDTDGNADD